MFGVDRAGLRHRIDRLFLAWLERMVESKKRLPEQKSVIQAIADTGAEIGVEQEVVRKAQETTKEEEQQVDFVPYADLVVEITEL